MNIERISKGGWISCDEQKGWFEPIEKNCVHPKAENSINKKMLKI